MRQDLQPENSLPRSPHVYRKKITDPYVRVELLNFNVHVLGEVNKPQSVKVEKERFSILEALAAAGDLTPYGDRSTVLLIRQEDGKNRYHHLNLNDAELLSSPFFSSNKTM